MGTGAARHAIVKTPVPVFGIEGRYAAALYSAANKNGALEAVEKDLVAISSTMKTDPRLGDFLLDPSVSKGLKLDGIDGVFQRHPDGRPQGRGGLCGHNSKASRCCHD